jgi:hypothetical protein
MNRLPMNRVQMAIVGVIGLIVGVVAGGAVFGGDTKTESVTQTTTTVVTKGKTKTKTVRRGGGAAAVKTVTRTITKNSGPYVAPGETAPGGGGGGRTVVNGTKVFTGKNTKNFGTLKLDKDSTLDWTNTGQVFSIISQTQLHVSSTKKKGSVKLYKGSYFNFRVAAVGRWKVTITPR